MRTCKWNGNLDACGNETCWDLGECQGSPPMSGEKEPTQEEIERSFNEAANQLISNAAVRARYVRKEKYDAVLKALAELIKHSVSLCEILSETDLQEYRQEVKAAIDRAKKLLNK